MTPIDHIATMAANDYINRFCLDMEMTAKLLTWQQVYDTLIAALAYQRDSTAQHREALLHASEN